MGAQFTADQTQRDLGEQSGAVTGAVRGAGPTMIQPLETLHGEAGYPIGGNPVEGGNEPDATSVTRRARIKERCRHHSLELGERESLNTVLPGKATQNVAGPESQVSGLGLWLGS
jgi:hypothetical protein